MTAYTELRKFVAPEFIYGLDARRLVGRYARNYALRRVLLVSDPGLERAGWLAEVEQLLLTDGVEVRRWTSVSPNPRAHEVMEGVAVYKQEACDGIVALGGGSVLDAAKGIGIVATNEGNILDYEGMDRVPIPMPPLICIPTTAGSAS
ncbi:MAG TPA: iron-containing alcohol dehydrogenase, partial [Opitutaceae bacterium]|nr:iron-containing alcohol dehydrogenase [Opitutaceae bacterium]HPG17649.1 iron-containing alcohol dehydrogenase [Opitutaceae bacterium]HQL21739.1 iron-containing alcohol dehydrogenase [Opitutaceae bacterium]